MSSIVRFFHAFVVLLALLASTFAWGADPMAKMDAILDEAPSLKEFLKSRDLRNRYYDAAREFFDGEGYFSREIYTAILQQLAAAIKKTPELDARLWEVQSGEQALGQAFEIRSTVKTYGREVNVEKWQHYYYALKENLKISAGPSFNLSPSEQAEFVGSVLRMIEKKKSEVPKDQLRSFSKDLVEKNIPLRAAASLVAHHYLSRANIEKAILSFEADLIFARFADAQKMPGELVRDFGVSSSRESSYLETVVKKLLPSEEKLLSDTALFPRQKTLVNYVQRTMSPGEPTSYEFFVPKRKFHTIWKGVPLDECIGGSLEFKESLLPARWASASLNDVIFHYVIQGSRYRGFTQITAVRKEGAEPVYGSIDFGLKALNKKAVVTNAEGKETATTLFALWFEKIQKQIPKKWKGLVVGTSLDGDNAGVLSAVHESAPYLRGKFVGDGESFVPVDEEMSKKIFALREADDRASRYTRDQVVIDATFLEQEELTLLKPLDAFLEIEEQQGLQKLAMSGKLGFYKQRGLLVTLEKKPVLSQREWGWVVLAFKSPNWKVRRQALDIIAEHLSWPEEVWDLIPDLANDTYGIGGKLNTVLAANDKAVLSFWLRVPTFFEKKNFDAASRLLSRFKIWPQEFWAIIPQVIRYHPKTKARFEMVKALRDQPIWPKEVWVAVNEFKKRARNPDVLKEVQWVIDNNAGAQIERCIEVLQK